jgi:hypothetical protein
MGSGTNCWHRFAAGHWILDRRTHPMAKKNLDEVDQLEWRERLGMSYTNIVTGHSWMVKCLSHYNGNKGMDK